jgi:hypothetical protein
MAMHGDTDKASDVDVCAAVQSVFPFMHGAAQHAKYYRTEPSLGAYARVM